MTFEQKIENAVIALTRARGGVCWKWVSPGRRGVPDRICIFPGGAVIFVELKRPGRGDGRSPGQKKVFSILERLSCQVWLIDDAAEFSRRLEEVLQDG